MDRSYLHAGQDRVLQWRTELSYHLTRAFPERPVLFLSVHVNSSPHPKASGAEVFYYTDAGQGSASRDFAQSIAKHYRPIGRTKTMSADFGVLRCQDKQTPAVLLELGFLTNKDDRHLLSSAIKNGAVAERLAGMIADGVRDYLDGGRDKDLLFARADPAIAL